MKHEPIVKANEWRIKHKEHVEKLLRENEPWTIGYEPSKEDENHPELWKPAHWMWFMFNT